MLIPFQSIFAKYSLNITGILHIGAHECEELHEYEKVLPRNLILWVEALEDKIQYCRAAYPGVLIEQAVVSDIVEDVVFHRSNNDQSSSILELGLHKDLHPQVWYISDYHTTTTKTQTILDLEKYTELKSKINFINLDIQGVELKALKGLDSSFLNQIDYIYTEVNCDYVYEKCAIISEIDEFLASFGFERVETCWSDNYKWGDAFYLKK